jgi:uncharacterized spore protein YtfJ
MEQRLASEAGEWSSTTSASSTGAGSGADVSPQPCGVVTKDKEVAISRLEAQVEEQVSVNYLSLMATYVLHVRALNNIK